MTCSDFIDNFSDFIDGLGDTDLRTAATAHLDACPSCQRYQEVFLQGRALLRSQEAVEPSEDFHPRLQHRLYHVDDERALSRSRTGPAPTVMLFGVAALLAVIVVSPDWFDEPEVTLSPIVVDRPAPRPLGLRSTLPVLIPSAWNTLDIESGDLWRQPSALLFEYAPVRERYRGMVRAGIQ